MLPFRSLMLLAALVAGAALPARAEVYKYYDRDGNLVLSDKVPKERADRVERLPVREIMVVPALAPAGKAAPPARPAAAPRAGYAIVAASPAAGATYARGPEPVPVAVSVSPALAPGHRLEFVLDGKVSASLDALPVQEMTPGPHVLAVRVVDVKGAVLKGVSVTFRVE